MGNGISEKELEERVALLKRFKDLLEKQRQKFRDYLNVLEKQADVIENQDTEALMIHTELEQQIVANIQNLQKVIEPIEQMYVESSLNSDDSKILPNSSEIPILKTDLQKLQNEVLAQNSKNRQMLKVQIEELRTKIQGLKNPYKYNKSIYSNTESSASIISIEG